MKKIRLRRVFTGYVVIFEIRDISQGRQKVKNLGGASSTVVGIIFLLVGIGLIQKLDLPWHHRFRHPCS